MGLRFAFELKDWRMREAPSTTASTAGAVIGPTLSTATIKRIDVWRVAIARNRPSSTAIRAEMTSSACRARS